MEQTNTVTKKLRCRYNSKYDNNICNVLYNLDIHNEHKLWKFSKNNTYYIIGNNNYDYYIDKNNGYKLIEGILESELQNYVLATYLNGEQWIIHKEDVSSYFLENTKIIKNHNAKIMPHKINGYAMIYIRTSVVDDRSISNQLEICLNYALNYNLLLVPFGIQIDNGVSARHMKNLDRELGFWSKHLSNGYHLILTNVDRLSRNYTNGIKFLNNLANKNIMTHFVNENLIYSNDLQYNYHREHIDKLLMCAEQYSNTISQKTIISQKIYANRKLKFALMNKSHSKIMKCKKKPNGNQKLNNNDNNNDDNNDNNNDDNNDNNNDNNNNDNNNDDNNDKNNDDNNYNNYNNYNNIGDKVKNIERSILNMSNVVNDFGKLFLNFTKMSINNPNTLNDINDKLIKKKSKLSQPIKKNTRHSQRIRQHTLSVHPFDNKISLSNLNDNYDI